MRVIHWLSMAWRWFLNFIGLRSAEDPLTPGGIAWDDGSSDLEAARERLGDAHISGHPEAIRSALAECEAITKRIKRSREHTG